MPKRTGRGRRRTQLSQRPGRSIAQEGSSPGDPLARLMDSPQLARVVPHLPPETLHRIIQHCGLDACDQLVASATPAQMASVFDLDLWRSAQPGDEEHFDSERFGEWLEMLADGDGAAAARIVAAMDEHLVTAGLSRYIRVFDPAAIVLPTSDDGEPFDVDVMPHGGPERELGGYLIRAIRADTWDAIVALLLALDANYQDRFHAVMRACRRLSDSRPESDGLDDLLTAPEQLLHDAALDRERRRSQQGYSTAADARAFLLMARTRRRPSEGEPPVNPIAAAYFRGTDGPVESDDDGVQDDSRRALGASATGPAVPEGFDAVVDVLATAGLAPQRPLALLGGTHSQSSGLARIRALMEYVRASDDTVFAVRSLELAFLANTLIAGCSIQSRSFTPQEASDAAASVCNLGLEHWPAYWPDSSATSRRSPDTQLPDAFLMEHGLVSAFEAGWAVLHEKVGAFAAGRLLLALSDLQYGDTDIEQGLETLRSELRTHCREGTPWRARDALDVIAMLDMPAWVGVLGLLDECPVIPAALTAILEGRTGAISASEFEFISMRSQLGKVREFMARFPDILR